MRRMFSLEQLKGIADSRVKSLVEGGTLENAKPIYFHPISIIKRTGDIQYNLGFTILNNTPTAFTFTTFKQFIDNLYTQIGGVVRMICTGYYDNGDSDDRKSGAVSVLAKVTESNIQLLLGDRNSNSNYISVSTWADLFGEPAEFTDGVNKIN